jgi:hypothetical protein
MRPVEEGHGVAPGLLVGWSARDVHVGGTGAGGRP